MSYCSPVVNYTRTTVDMFHVRWLSVCIQFKVLLIIKVFQESLFSFCLKTHIAAYYIPHRLCHCLYRSSQS